MPRQIRTFGSRWSAGLRLVGVVTAGALWLAAWMFLHAGSSGRERIWAALMAAFVPVVLAWPYLVRATRAWRRARGVASLGEVDRLRRFGAI